LLESGRSLKRIWKNIANMGRKDHGRCLLGGGGGGNGKVNIQHSAEVNDHG
jgi:hypothetical protein